MLTHEPQPTGLQPTIGLKLHFNSKWYCMWKTGVLPGHWISGGLLLATTGSRPALLMLTRLLTNHVLQEYYQGTGAVVGVLPALTDTQLPGSEVCVAQGNALGKGPVLFHFPQVGCL